MKPIKFRQNIVLGCDPEFFFADRRGNVIGSEKVLTVNNKGAGLIIDGVQAELNPLPSTCRESLASAIANCFQRLSVIIGARDDDVQLKMDALVDVSQRELDSLSSASRQFGCAPSTNIYNSGENKTSEIKANPATYLKRSAGGHIHLGNAFSSFRDVRYATIDSVAYNQAVCLDKALRQMPEIMVPILDIIVANTCVLLDQQPGNKERRQNYGRVGEYRIKDYGIEYRTLSNFWLRAYPLMSLVMGLSRFAVHIVSESTPENDYVKALFDAISRDDIVNAVNNNDFDLAMANFKKIEPIILMATDDVSRGHWPLSSKESFANFYHFVFRIQEEGLPYWFPDEPFVHWNGVYASEGGWERFASNRVANDLIQHRAQLKIVIDLNDSVIAGA